MTTSLAERAWDRIGKRGVRAADFYRGFCTADRSSLDEIVSAWIRAGLVTKELGVLEKPPKMVGVEYRDAMASLGLAASAQLPALAPFRKAVMPIQYEEACKAIATCVELDEAKHWSDKADALAAWAKMYQDDRVSLEARRLKLHAYRRMSALADEIDPKRPIGSLRNAGLSQAQAQTARAVGNVSQRLFDKAVAAKVPPTPGTLTTVLAAPCPEWRRVARALGVFIAISKHNPAGTLAKSLPPDQVSRARRMIAEMREWASRFDRACQERESEAA